MKRRGKKRRQRPPPTSPEAASQADVISVERRCLVLHAMRLVEFVVRGLGANASDHRVSVRYRLLASGNGHRPVLTEARTREQA